MNDSEGTIITPPLSFSPIDHEDPSPHTYNFLRERASSPEPTEPFYNQKWFLFTIYIFFNNFVILMSYIFDPKEYSKSVAVLPISTVAFLLRLNIIKRNREFRKLANLGRKRRRNLARIAEGYIRPQEDSETEIELGSVPSRATDEESSRRGREPNELPNSEESNFNNNQEYQYERLFFVKYFLYRIIEKLI